MLHSALYAQHYPRLPSAQYVFAVWRRTLYMCEAGKGVAYLRENIIAQKAQQALAPPTNGLLARERGRFSNKIGNIGFSRNATWIVS